MVRRSGGAPSELLDIDGEGIYLLGDVDGISPLWRAAALLLGDRREWRDIDFRSVWLEPSESGDEWVPANLGRWPRGWRLNLPSRWFRGVRYLYCTPKESSCGTPTAKPSPKSESVGALAAQEGNGDGV